MVKYRPPVQGWSKLAHSQGSSGACLPADIICADFNHHQQSSTIAMDVQPQKHHHHHKGPGHGVKCKTKGKWTCASCTFTNWPNAGQCTMCGTLRTRGGIRHDPIISTGGRRELSRSPVLSESILDYASGMGGAVGGAAYHAGSSDEKAPPSSSHDLPIRPVNGKSRQNSRNSKRSSSQQQTENNNMKKWKCHECTYENWPRAMKCIMCQSSRRRTPSPPLSGGEGERDTPRIQLSTDSIQSHQSISRLASASRPLSSSSNSSSPDHLRSSANSNEKSAMSQQRSSPDVPNTATSSQKEPGSGNRLIGKYERESYVEIVPSSQLKSDSDEVRREGLKERGREREGGREGESKGGKEREKERERVRDKGDYCFHRLCFR